MHRTWIPAAIAVFAIAATNGVAGQGSRDPHDFINTMAIAGMAEVQLGKVAAERAQDPDVKAFGQLMVKDHTEANDELKQAASQVGAQLPTQLDDKHRELADHLMKLQGGEFDREYMKAMVDGHENVADQLLRQAGWIGTSTRDESSVPTAVGTSGSDSGDSRMRLWAMKTLPVVQQHLQRAREIRDKVEKGR
jgi:putative membrane protein